MSANEITIDASYYKIHSSDLTRRGVKCRPSIWVGNLRNHFVPIVHYQLKDFVVVTFAQLHCINTWEREMSVVTFAG